MREFEHDNLYRLVEERWLDGETVVHTITSTWDAASQLSSISDAFATYAYSRDNLGRVTSADNDGTPNAPDVVLSYGYDAAGRRTSLSAEIDSTPDFLNTYTRDALGRITRIEQEGQSGGNSVAEKRVDLAYVADGSFDVISRYEDLAGTDLVATSTWGYDDAGRLTSLEHAKGANTLADYSWTYDAASRITQFVSDDGTTDYGYDNTNQLTSADHASQSDETFSWDANGNPTMSGFDVDSNNRLTSDGTSDYEYDEEGNRTRKTTIATGDYVDYSWDHRNRLKLVTFKTAAGATTKQVRYSYDPADRRIGKEVDDDGNGTFDREEWFVYDGNDIVLAFNGSGSMTHRYLHGPSIDQVLADEDALGEILWALGDQQNTVRDLADYEAGTDTTSIANHIRYTAFGEIESQTDANVGVFHAWTGQEWDPDSELFYFLHRWYDPSLLRFASEDPWGLGPDTNPSRYVVNSPPNGVDPDGRTVSFNWADPSVAKIPREAQIEVEQRILQELREMVEVGGLTGQLAHTVLTGPLEFDFNFRIGADPFATFPRSLPRDAPRPGIHLDPTLVDEGFIRPSLATALGPELPNATATNPDARMWIVLLHEAAHRMRGLALTDPIKNDNPSGTILILENTIRFELGMRGNQLRRTYSGFEPPYNRDGVLHLVPDRNRPDLRPPHRIVPRDATGVDAEAQEEYGRLLKFYEPGWTDPAVRPVEAPRPVVPRPGPDPATAAGRQLELANQFMERARREEAAEARRLMRIYERRLREIISEFPGTPAAEEAMERLDDLNP